MKECAYCNTRHENEARKCKECGAAAFRNVCANCGGVFETGFCPSCGLAAGDEGWRCAQCGAVVFGQYCTRCGSSASGPQQTIVQYIPVATPPAPAYGVAPAQAVGKPAKKKSRWALLALWYVCGAGLIPIYYRYANRRAGVLRVLTLNYLMVGAVTDMVLILAGRFRDGSGAQIR